MKKKSLYSIGAILVVLVSVLILSNTLKTNAKENNNSDREKFYTSILIEEGDSLWSIAEEHRPDKSISIKKYISELKLMNNMESDVIHAGNYLTIYYYNE